MAIPIIDGILGVVNTVGGIFTNWQERKKIESAGKVEIAKATVEGEVKRKQTVVEGDINYDQSAVEGMRYSWKDEWFALLLSAPFIMCFIPPLQDYVKQGFEILAGTPEWYQWCFIGAIVASFGLRGWNMKRNGKHSDAPL